MNETMGNVTCCSTGDAVRDNNELDRIKSQLHHALELQRQLQLHDRVLQEELRQTQQGLEFTINRIGEYEQVMLEHGLEKVCRSHDGKTEVVLSLRPQQCQSSLNCDYGDALTVMTNAARSSDAILKRHFETMWRRQCRDVVK